MHSRTAECTARRRPRRERSCAGGVEEAALAARLDGDDRRAGLGARWRRRSEVSTPGCFRPIDDGGAEHVLADHAAAATVVPSLAIATPVLQTFPPVVSSIVFTSASPPGAGAAEVHRRGDQVGDDQAEDGGVHA